jgi:hypothetical protein
MSRSAADTKDAWPTLPAVAKASILAMVKAAGRKELAVP